RAARAYYGRLLEAGVRIWEFEACRLHTKLIVLDDAVYLGSANFDARSLYINLEIVLYIEDADLARRMRQFMDDLLPAAREITPAVHAERATWWNRVRWRLRSEEHTSELQSRENLVCRLLLEKKKREQA